MKENKDGKKILIVDDKKLLRESLMDYLSGDQFEFVEADNGEKAVELFRDENIDLVLLDEKLPGIDGIKTLQLMKKIKKNIPIIGLTGELSIEIREMYLKAGAYDVQAKSAIYEKLIPVMEKALSGKEIEKIEEDVNYDKLAEALKNDNRWEESALYLKEAGIEQKILGNKEAAEKYFTEAILRYRRAGRTSKAEIVEGLLKELK